MASYISSSKLSGDKYRPAKHGQISLVLLGAITGEEAPGYMRALWEFLHSSLRLESRILAVLDDGNVQCLDLGGHINAPGCNNILKEFPA